MPSNSELPELIFGSLSTEAGRLDRARIDRLGFIHDLVLNPVDPKPGETITISVSVGKDINLASATLFYTTDGTSPSEINGIAGAMSTQGVPMQRDRLAWDTLEWSYLEQWSAVLPGQSNGTHVQYLIIGRTLSGETIYCPTINWGDEDSSAGLKDPDLIALKQRIESIKPRIYGFFVDERCAPVWLKDAVIYQIFVDRFAPNPGEKFKYPPTAKRFCGGTLKGVISKLDYLQELGVNCLWLTPIFKSPSHHGYDTTDYGQIEPRLGTLADFQELVTKAHQRGIRILLDFAANHMSKNHPAFKAAQASQDSPTFDWFFFLNWPDRYECYYQISNLPKINTDNLQARSFLIDHACRWLDLGADGFRLDHAHGVTHAFWSAFRSATSSTNPSSTTLGEVTDTPNVIRSYTGRMDGSLDFPLLESLRNFFVYQTIKPSDFEKRISQHYAYFEADFVLPSFLDNHDMNRILWVLQGDKRRLRLMALCQFTLPGPPIIYYGTEVGLSQIRSVGNLDEARLPMLWENDQDQHLLKFFKDLVHFRRDNPTYWRGERKALLIDDHRNLYAYVCEPYAVVMNNSVEASKVSFGDLGRLEAVITTDQAVTANMDTRAIHLPPYSGGIFRIEANQ